MNSKHVTMDTNREVQNIQTPQSRLEVQLYGAVEIYVYFFILMNKAWCHICILFTKIE